jgi:hypothetical protein
LHKSLCMRTIQQNFMMDNGKVKKIGNKLCI